MVQMAVAAAAIEEQYVSSSQANCNFCVWYDIMCTDTLSFISLGFPALASLFTCWWWHQKLLHSSIKRDQKWVAWLVHRPVRLSTKTGSKNLLCLLSPPFSQRADEKK